MANSIRDRLNIIKKNDIKDTEKAEFSHLPAYLGKALDTLEADRYCDL